MENIRQQLLEQFDSISLSELNASASFLKRIDTKYLLTMSEFKDILSDLKKHFKVLEIKGRKIFCYDNIYMDTNDHLFYKQHQNKDKKRSKIRTRYYVDSNLAFFEFKQKEKGITNKFRYEFPAEEHGFMTKGKKRFFDGVWQSIYGEKAPKISPAIQTHYKRITMVSIDGSERLTIDLNIRTKNLRVGNSKEINLTNLVIVESKSLKPKGIATKIMKAKKIKKAKSCSKYSLGVVYSGLATKYDTFKETMDKIKAIRMETIKNKQRTANINFVARKLDVKKSAIQER